MADCVRHGGREPNGSLTVNTGSNDRLAAWSVQLARAHDHLRRQLRVVRANLNDTEAGNSDLMSHCLAFCSALTTHHGGEDDGLFGELLRARPDLEAVIANLVQDHRMIAAVLSSARALTTEASLAKTDRRAAISREFDGMAAIVESHFRYEERSISDVLDSGIRDTGWRKPVLDLET